MDAAEEGGQAPEVVLLPGLERVVVALGAVEPDAEERPGHPGGEALGVGRSVSCVDGDGDEVRRRVVGPEAPVGDQVADDLVVGAVLARIASLSQATNRRRRKTRNGPSSVPT